MKKEDKLETVLRNIARARKIAEIFLKEAVEQGRDGISQEMALQFAIDRIDDCVGYFVRALEKAEKQLAVANRRLEKAENVLRYIEELRHRLIGPKAIDWHVGSICVEKAEAYFRLPHQGKGGAA